MVEISKVANTPALVSMTRVLKMPAEPHSRGMKTSTHLPITMRRAHGRWDPFDGMGRFHDERVNVPTQPHSDTETISEAHARSVK